MGGISFTKVLFFSLSIYHDDTGSQCFFCFFGGVYMAWRDGDEYSNLVD